MDKMNGTCGCGCVGYQINSRPLNVINCHCDMCRTHNGSAFSTYAIFPTNAFEIVQGHEYLSKYMANNGEKNFCTNCGTPIFSQHDRYTGIRMLFLGILPTLKDLQPKLNVWTEKQLTWVNKIPKIESVAKGVNDDT